MLITASTSRRSPAYMWSRACALSSTLGTTPYTRSVLIFPLLWYIRRRAAAKHRYTWSTWGQKHVHCKIKSKAHSTSPATGPKRIASVFRRIKPRHARVCLHCLTVFCRFLVNQRSSMVPPYAPQLNADVRGDPLTYPPHPTLRHTNITRISYTPRPRYHT